MTDQDLLAIIEMESRQAIGTSDITAQQRAKMLAYYMGEAKFELAPPEIEGRSQVVSKDMADTVEWMMPSLMHLFAGSDDVVTFQPEIEGDEQKVKDATDYVSYLFWRRNPGFRVLHDAIKNALLQRQALVKVYCDEAWDERIERYDGISGFDLEILSEDPSIEIVEANPAGEQMMPQDGGYAVDQSYNVVAKRKEKKRHKRVIGVPPEEMRFNKAARTIEEARFIQQRSMKSLSDLISMGYDRATVLRVPTENSDRQYTFEMAERGYYDNSVTDYATARMDESMREVELCETYIKVDWDDDGVAEYRRVVHAGRIVFENDITDDHPFALFTPILMPYKAVGLGMWDLCEDLQRIRTALTRQMLDNAYFANNPRQRVVENQVNMDDLLNPRPGGIVRVSSVGMVEVDTIPFIGGQALTMLDHFGQVRDQRTGVVSGGTSLNPEALQKTDIGSEGAQQMMDAAAMRIELIARVFAETGLSRVWQLLLKLAVQYADRDEQVKVNGRWLRVNPREWADRYETAVNVGTGTTNKRQKLQNAMTLLQVQREAAPEGLATPENVFEALSLMVEAMGYRDANRFFTSPQNAAPKQEGPPIELQLEQMKQQGAQQLAQVKAQADIEVERMKQQYQAEDAQLQKQLEAERDRQKLEADMALAQFKAEKDAELQAYKAELQRDQAIEVARINAEAKILSAKTMGAKDASTADEDANEQEEGMTYGD
ncbi:MAG TPA: hypothetical protein VFS41_07775 [Edaphobacter sp.]|nr:hypothetical protein [Edaphobacter sp.]